MCRESPFAPVVVGSSRSVLRPPVVIKPSLLLLLLLLLCHAAPDRVAQAGSVIAPAAPIGGEGAVAPRRAARKEAPRERRDAAGPCRKRIL